MMPDSPPLFPDAIAHPDRWLRIESLGDVQAYLCPERGIHAFDHAPFTLVRYTSALPDTFRTAGDLECRSLIFDREGALLSRTFHKFFNLGERENLASLPIEKGVDLQIKIDGSMIGAFIHDGDVVFHTRGGVSHQALAARAMADTRHLHLVREAFEAGMTPIFEYTSPENRVIIPYDKPDLTLLALRHRKTGAYDRGLARNLARRHGVAVVESLATGLTSREDLVMTINEIGARTDIEGVVLDFPDGHRIKSKTADYHRRHKILANIAHERHVYRCYLEDLADDTAAALGGARGRHLLAFMERIEAAIAALEEEIRSRIAPLAGRDPAERAREIRAQFSGNRQTVAFAAAKGLPVRTTVRNLMEKRIHSPDKRESLKSDLGLPDWDIDILSLR